MRHKGLRARQDATSSYRKPKAARLEASGLCGDLQYLPVGMPGVRSSMTRPCKIDHTAEDAPPAILCRMCHPELTPTPEENLAWEREHRERLRAEEKRQRKLRELASAQERVAGYVRRGWPEEGSVGDKIATALRKKVERLTKELNQ
jgi:hypothetical protein